MTEDPDVSSNLQEDIDRLESRKQPLEQRADELRSTINRADGAKAKLRQVLRDIKALEQAISHLRKSGASNENGSAGHKTAQAIREIAEPATAYSRDEIEELCRERGIRPQRRTLDAAIESAFEETEAGFVLKQNS